jgi:hypothetical protein
MINDKLFNMACFLVSFSPEIDRLLTDQEILDILAKEEEKNENSLY